MGDFYKKAQTMIRDQSPKFDEYLDIIDRIFLTGLTQTFFAYSPLNLEEAFSLLEMRDFAEKTEHRKTLEKFVIEVIKYLSLIHI